MKVLTYDLENNVLKLVTSSLESCEKLTIAFSPLDIYHIPIGLKEPKGTIDDIKSYVTRLDEIIGGTIEPNPLDQEIINFEELEHKFKINFEVWEKHKNDTTDGWDYNMTYKSRNYDQTIKLHIVTGWGKLMLIKNESKYFATYFQCPNKKFGCYYQSSKKHDIEKHVKICKDPNVLRETPHCKQKEFGKDLHPINDMIKLGVITDEPKMDTFIFYDIESLCVKDEKTVGKSEILSTHQLLSIAANAYINGQHETRSWVIEDSTPESQEQIVDKFLDFVFDIDRRRIISSAVLHAQTLLDTKIEKEKSKLEEDAQRLNIGMFNT